MNLLEARAKEALFEEDMLLSIQTDCNLFYNRNDLSKDNFRREFASISLQPREVDRPIFRINKGEVKKKITKDFGECSGTIKVTRRLVSRIDDNRSIIDEKRDNFLHFKGFKGLAKKNKRPSKLSQNMIIMPRMTRSIEPIPASNPSIPSAGRASRPNHMLTRIQEHRVMKIRSPSYPLFNNSPTSEQAIISRKKRAKAYLKLLLSKFDKKPEKRQKTAVFVDCSIKEKIIKNWQKP